MLLIRRARILKQARGKVPLAAQILRDEYRGDRWLVYCDDIAQLNALTRECLDAGLPALEFLLRDAQRPRCSPAQSWPARWHRGRHPMP